MKLYAIYKDGRRVKRYGVHKTQDKALLKWADLNRMGDCGGRLSTFFDFLAVECALSDGGYSIQVMGETE